MPDLNEILNISEEGLALRSFVPLQDGNEIKVQFDLAEVGEKFCATGRVVWSDSVGCSGLRFAELPQASLSRLREWLFLRAISGFSDQVSENVGDSFNFWKKSRLNFTETVAILNSMLSEIESLGTDFEAALKLIVRRSQQLFGASAAGIALVTDRPQVMVCRASSGSCAPPPGTELHVGEGFSGECVRRGVPLCCNDTESDPRIDAEHCRALGIRSLVAAPVMAGSRPVGLVEVFSDWPDFFSDKDMAVLERVAQVVLNRINGMRLMDPAAGVPRGSIRPTRPLLAIDAPQPADSRLKRSLVPHSRRIFFLLGAAVLTSMLSLLVVWAEKEVKNYSATTQHLQSDSWHPAQARVPSETIEASSHFENANLETLKLMAVEGNAEAENELGQRYLKGDANEGLVRNEEDAAHWFLAAAENGNVAAQSKLAFLFWSGRGVAENLEKAYFWAEVASRNSSAPAGDPAVSLARGLKMALTYSGLTHAQAAAVERQAERWRPRGK